MEHLEPLGAESSFTPQAAPGLLGLWRAGQVLPEVGALRPGTCWRQRETGARVLLTLPFPAVYELPPSSSSSCRSRGGHRSRRK